MTPEPSIRTAPSLLLALGVLGFEVTLRFFGVCLKSESSDSSAGGENAAGRVRFVDRRGVAFLRDGRAEVRFSFSEVESAS